MTTDSTTPVTPPKTEQDVGTDQVQDISTDDVFHLLQNERRRAVVQYLDSEQGQVDLGDLADWIAARECDSTVEEISSDARQRVYISLYQSHLPKLDDHGVVDYDSEENVVVRGDNADVLVQPLQFEATGGDDTDGDSARTVSWLSCYLGISLGGVLSIVATSLLAIPASVLSIQALNVILLGLYSLTVAGNIIRPQGLL